MITYTKEALAQARREGLFLIKLTVNGQHVGKGSLEISAAVGAELAEKIYDLITEVAQENCERKVRKTAKRS